MKIKFNKNTLSNIIFIIALGVLLYPPSRTWFLRQIAFSPSIEHVDDRETLSTYQWQLKGLNVPNANFEDFKGKVVFVNFWATWCPPCRAEMPMIQKLYDTYKNEVAFVFVTQENWETVAGYFNKKGYQLPVYNSYSLAPQQFRATNALPASYLIDKKGNIVIAKTGAANWNSTKIKNLVAALVKE